jgi:type III secretory pathway component EscT
VAVRFVGGLLLMELFLLGFVFGFVAGTLFWVILPLDGER